MSTTRRRAGHWIVALAIALIAAGGLATGRAVVGPSPVAAWPGGCQTQQKIAFIAFPGQEGLEQMQAPLRELRELWPVRKLKFRYLDAAPDNSPAGVDAIVDELEARVDYLEANGFKRIGLPTYSYVLAPFINGTAGSLGGVNLQTRHPNTVFVTMRNGTDATEDPAAAGNVFRFLDVPSYDTSLELSVDDLVGPAGEMLILYQSADVVSESVRDQYLDLATDLGITASAMALTYDGFDFDTDMPAAKAALDALPAGSLVVHITNSDPSYMDLYETSAIGAGIFVDESTNGPIRHFAGNFFPLGKIPVALELGYQAFDRPSWQSTRAGFSDKLGEWRNDFREKLYMEAFGFLAKCGKFNGILDGFLRFDEGGTRIDKVLERVYLPAGSAELAYGERIDNPRWYDEQAAWDWDAVFGE